MGEAKFTPRPWVISPLGAWIIEAKNEIEIADISSSSLVNAKANAHLIAAAPELYEALEGLVIFCSDTLSGRADGPTDTVWLKDGYREIRERCRFALEKARGETT